MLELKNVVKKQGKQIVLNGLDACFDDEKIYGVVIPDLYEKEPLLAVMTGSEPISGGQIVISTIVLNDDPIHAKRRIGYLASGTPAYDNMTVGEFAVFVARMKSLSKKDAQTAAAASLEKFGIDSYSNVLIKDLTKETKQLLGLAQSFIGSPKFVLLDEPMRDLTPLKIMLVRDIIKKESQTSSVIIFTNSLSEVARLCDEVLIVYQGKKAVMGGREELIEYLAADNKINSYVSFSDAAAAAVQSQSVYTEETEELSDEDVINMKSEISEWGTDGSQSDDQAADTVENTDDTVIEAEVEAAQSDDSDKKEEYYDLSFEELMERAIIKVYSDTVEIDDESISQSVVEPVLDETVSETEISDDGSDSADPQDEAADQIDNGEEK